VDDDRPGGGGYGGYLTSQTEGTNWLFKPDLKMLVGYPVEGVADSARGIMHFLGPDQFAFEPVLEGVVEVFTSQNLRGLPGMSGGPVCVQARNSLGNPFFLPAAVYVGSSDRGFARIIDVDVADLINRAERSGSVGGDHGGGGVVLFPRVSGKVDLAHVVKVLFGPAEAIAQGGGWRVAPADALKITDAATLTNFANDHSSFYAWGASLEFELKEIPDFVTPDSFELTMQNGDTDYLIDLRYVPRRTTPTLTWSNPSSVVYGTALSSVQLNATSSVNGIFNYQPPVGTILAAGYDQKLAATFVPQDTNKYASATGERIINVERASLTVRAVSAQKVYGQATPTLTAIFEGLVNGDTEANLDVPVRLFCDATADSLVGTYEIQASDAEDSNYNIRFESGVLEIVPATDNDLRLTVQNESATCVIQFPSVSGKRYQVESCPTLDKASIWVPEGLAIIGDDSLRGVSVSASTKDRFFRVKLLQP
jgi:hypothetical protein